MDVTSTRSERYFTELQEKYLDSIEEVGDIDSVVAYLKAAGAVSNISDFNSVARAIEQAETGYGSFFRASPHRDQKVMYASLNPGMPNPMLADHFSTGQYKQIGEVADDMQALTFKVAQGWGEYVLGDDGDPEALINIMQSSLDYLPGPKSKSTESYLTISDPSDIAGSFYNDVYHTRFFKLASVGGTFYKSNFDRQDWQSEFTKELDMVSPKLLMCGCKDVWHSVLYHWVEDTSSVVPHRGASVVDSYGRGDSSAVGEVYEIPQKDAWVVTHFHESRGTDQEKLRTNLEYVNNHLQ